MKPPRRARQLKRLTARQVATLAPGQHADGGGLYLAVDPSGARRWIFRFRWRPNRSVPGAGREREMGLGGVQAVSLAEARAKAEDARKLLNAGTDPYRGQA